MRLYERFADKGFHTSIATTFGIDFDAYENIVLPRLRGAGCRNNMVLADCRMLTHALDGASALPRQAGKLYTVEGAAARGLFHPKLFLQVGRKAGRLIIGSANLTAAGLAGNLELVTMLDYDSDDESARGLITQAWLYLSGLIDPASPMLPTQREWMLNRTPWLRNAEPSENTVTLSDGSAAALLIAKAQSGIASRFAALVGERVERLIVISPYWDDQLAALDFLQGELEPKEIAVLIDRDAELFPSEAAGSIRNLTLYERDKFETGRFIHAKALIAETAGADHLLIGSANCTIAALGSATFAGSNDEASLYRRLPPSSVAEALGLAKLLGRENRIDPDDLAPQSYEDDIPLDQLAAQHPGTFSLRGETLVWQPSPNVDPVDCQIELMTASGQVLGTVLRRLENSSAEAVRFLIDIADEVPTFAHVIGPKNFPPAIITYIDALQVAIRETHSRKTENALAQLDGETEANLALLEVLDILEKIEGGDEAGTGEGVSIPTATKQNDESDGQSHRALSYEDFIAGRRPHHAGPVLHNSLRNSDVSIVRGFLNRIVGLGSLTSTSEDDDDQAFKAAFNLGDETEDAQAALAAGDDFDTETLAKTPIIPDEEERRRKAVQRKATKEQLVTAASNYAKRIEIKQQAGALSTRDFLRLRALLMIICAAAWKGTDRPKDKQARSTALQVLPVEGDPNSWPFVMGRLLFRIFGGPNPAIVSLSLEADHDQIPADLIECWATCFWCLQACLAAPVSQAERARIDRYIKPLAVQAYVRTHLSEQELLADSILTVMEGLSGQYADRIGVSRKELDSSHKTLSREVYEKRN
ncbi:hypothetical protein K5P26_14510 [Sphingopyxis sp. XHP0097]|uniref:Phospholipase D-like domain-containing protein n=1 Tax=Sphingopyxis jiangsuensis TaxID=2871171 RepID=A0ABS7MHC4_9SPHN|nr:hypothetical protein [Sphingopyxis jiangsuensis]MBY4638353.1 hypothetical protein [Sphingopyxis jiangsuensis]